MLWLSHGFPHGGWDPRASGATQVRNCKKRTCDGTAPGLCGLGSARATGVRAPLGSLPKSAHFPAWLGSVVVCWTKRHALPSQANQRFSQWWAHIPVTKSGIDAQSALTAVEIGPPRNPVPLLFHCGTAVEQNGSPRNPVPLLLHSGTAVEQNGSPRNPVPLLFRCGTAVE